MAKKNNKNKGSQQDVASNISYDSFNPGSYDKFKLKDIEGLRNYLMIGAKPGALNGVARMTPFNYAGKGMGKYKAGAKLLSDYMGVSKINSKDELRRALGILAGANEPLAGSLAYRSGGPGIKQYNSLNDYLATLGGGIGAPNKQVAPTITPDYTPEVAQSPEPYSGGDMTNMSMPAPPAVDTTPQGTGGLPGGGAGIDSAAGLKSKKSSRRQLGLSTKGTKQLNRSMMISNLNFA